MEQLPNHELPIVQKRIETRNALIIDRLEQLRDDIPLKERESIQAGMEVVAPYSEFGFQVLRVVRIRNDMVELLHEENQPTIHAKLSDLFSKHDYDKAFEEALRDEHRLDTKPLS